MSLTKRVTCTGCAQQCGLVAEVEGGRVVRLRGDREHPTSQGFVCPKGARAHELLHDPSRLTSPRKRVGPRGGGQWVDIGWEQALDEIAEALERLRDRHGPECVAYSFGTMHGADVGLGERFMNLFGSPNTVGQDKICYGPNVIGEVLTYGWGPTMYTPPTPGITGCDVLWGLHPSASMPLLWRAISKARKAGSKLVVIDPNRTHEARLADVFLQVRPGTDAAMALGLINVIIEEGLYDEAFVASSTVGFEALKRRAAEYPTTRVSELTGVAHDAIVLAARTIAGSGPMLIHGGNGLCQIGSSAVQTGRALACLIAITGNVGVEGGHQLAGPPSHVLANGAAVLCDELSAEQRAKRLGGTEFPVIGDGYAALSDAVSRAWYGDKHAVHCYSSAHEPSLWRAIRSGEPYPVRALFLQCHNAVGSSANTQDAAAALLSENLELVVVHDLFMNKTASLADYVLPAAHWLEKPFYSAGYGYMGFSGDYAEAGRSAVPASQPSDYDLWRDLGHRLGQGDRWPGTVEAFWDSLLRPAGLSYDELCGHVGPVVGAAARRMGSPADATDRYGTPSGKVELESTLLDHWGLDAVPAFRAPEIFDNATDDYPLVLTTGGRMIEGFHQNAQQMSAFRARHPHPVVSMHPDTAADAGVTEGDWVMIETPIGAVRQLARLTDVLTPGVVHADRWWYPEREGDPDDPFGVLATNINVCTENASGSCDPVMGSWLLRALPCKVVGAPGIRADTAESDTATRG